jgi:Zn-finger nucleic acid-binding protein
MRRGSSVTPQGYDQGMRCPSCGGELLELDRSGVRIDACRQCRGVWLDRGELERILERERQVLGEAHDDDDFIREMTGRGKQEKSHGYGFDAPTAERIYSDYKSHRKHKKRKSVLDELFG